MSELPYRIEFSPEAGEHLHALTASQRALVVEAVDKQLRHQPGVETRNRKPMRPNVIARWELRIRDVRVYYQVGDDPEALVKIRAIGVKKRNRVWLGEKEVDFS